MPARFRAATATIIWHGTDDSTPPGHTIATGRDSLGTLWLWLFEGPDATDEAFRGSLSIPSVPGALPLAYGPRGGFVCTAPDSRDALARLAAL